MLTQWLVVKGIVAVVLPKILWPEDLNKFVITGEGNGVLQNSFEQSHWEFWSIPVQLIGQSLRFTVILILYLLGVHLPSTEFLPQVAGRRALDKFVFVLVSDHWHLG